MEKPKEPHQNKGPLKCWKCEGSHLRRYFPLENESTIPAYNIHGEETMGQVARVVPRIYAALEDRQAYHQSTVVEVAGNIVEQSVSIFFHMPQFAKTILHYLRNIVLNLMLSCN